MYQADVNAALAVAEDILYAIHKEYSIARNEHAVNAGSYYSFRDHVINRQVEYDNHKKAGRSPSYLKARRQELREYEGVRDRYYERMKMTAEVMNRLEFLAKVAETRFVDGGAAFKFYYRVEAGGAAKYIERPK